MRRDREAKAPSLQADAEKGVTDLLRSNLTYLLRLIQVAAQADLPTVWKEIVGPPKRQHLIMLQRALNDTARRLTICTLIFVMTWLLKLILAL